jgi:predicted metal-binding membrane protein
MLHAHAPDALAFWPLTLTWLVMMAAMMAPTAWPWVRAFQRFAGIDDLSGRARRLAATLQFAAGYLVAWLAYSAAAALAQIALRSGGMPDHATGSAASRAGAALFLVAGLYQFAPLKRACLTHCRSPFSFFLARWRNGPASGFRLGAQHGLYCLGCCWALMATALAVGAMSVGWKIALGAIAFVEQVAPYGYTLRRPLGIALVAAGVWRW